MTFDTLTLTRDAAIAEIRLRAADVAQARCLAELERAIGELHDDQGVRAVVLAIDGGEAGAAAEDASGNGASPATATASGSAALPFRYLELMRQPVIACVAGAISGSAFELMLACDIRIASEDATFVLRDIAEGRVPAGGATQRLPRLIGRARATEMLLLGAAMDARSAVACGLVNVVAPATEARERALGLARSIAARGPVGVAYAKEAILRGLDMPLEQALRYETDLTVILQTTEDRAEGVRAFLEKRAPRFEGR